MNTTAAAVKPAKTKPNLASVTPMTPPPKSPVPDTTTPIDVSILPFTQREVPKWSAWLLGRLGLIWPHFSPMNYLGILGQHMASNGSLLIHTRRAIILAVVTRETFEPRPVVDLVFCFKFYPDNEEHNKEVRLLFRRVEDWGKSLGAKYVRVLHPENIDATPSRLKEMLWSEEATISLKDLDK